MGIDGEVRCFARWPASLLSAAHAQPAPSRLDEIDKPGTRVIVDPGGTNERFARANVRAAEIRVFNDNTKIFDEIAKDDADLMMTDASETRYQQKLHPGVLCAVHPDKPLAFAEKSLLDATRRRIEGVRRPVASHHARGWQLREDLRGVV